MLGVLWSYRVLLTYLKFRAMEVRELFFWYRDRIQLKVHYKRR